jgi:probable rRNA maturation factor
MLHDTPLPLMTHDAGPNAASGRLVLQDDLPDTVLSRAERLHACHTAAQAAWPYLPGLPPERGPYEVTIRIGGAEEGQALNRDFRGKDYATNVLSFAAEHEDIGDFADETTPLGDVFVCWPVVVAEAETAGKPVAHHLSHLVVHGLLHLCGFDHNDDGEAQTMEALEAQILATMLIANPYESPAA